MMISGSKKFAITSLSFDLHALEVWKSFLIISLSADPLECVKFFLVICLAHKFEILQAKISWKMAMLEPKKVSMKKSSKK